MRLANTTKPVFVFWRDRPTRAEQTRRSAASSGTSDGSSGRLALLERQFPADPRGRLERPVAVARSGVRDPRRERRRVAAAGRSDPAALALAPERFIGKRGDDHRAVPRRQPLRRSAASGRQEPVGLRAAVRRRGDLGHGPPSAGQGLRSRPQRARRHRPLAQGRRHAAPRRARCPGSRRPRSPKPRRRPKASSRSPCRRRRSRLPQVVFSTPTAGETDADRSGARPDPVLAGHGPRTFAATCGSRTPARRRRRRRAAGAAHFTVRYNEGTRALEIKLARRWIASGRDRSTCWRASSATSTTSRSAP